MIPHAFIFTVFTLMPGSDPHQEEQGRLQAVPFTAVRFTGGLWAERLEINRRVTVPYDFQKCEETGRLANFARAAGREEGPHVGYHFNDSDVFKVIEGAAASLALADDPELQTFLDALIADIAGSQEEDGYLYTCRTIDPARAPPVAGPERWAHLAHSHELYNLGHMYEAAVAHHEATGKRALLDVAQKSADFLCGEFGPEGRRDVPGHQEIEIGLVKLYQVTGEQRYLDLALFFLDERGRVGGRELYGAYCQDHQPVLEQREAVGHAVRAVYMYCAMADIAAVTGDPAWLAAADGLWDDVAGRKMYLTGGVGSSRSGEAFGGAYDLPNASAYNETCAAIANALWNHRMFLLHGDARYLDVLERVIYNGFLAGVSLSGDRFFYPNPLACDGVSAFNQGSLGRSPWFGCSCCPVNVVRFVPAIPGFAYATRGGAVYVNLYAEGVAELPRAQGRLTVRQETSYPWDGTVTLSLSPDAAARFPLHLRVPGWARGQPVPTDLYRYRESAAPAVSLKVNGAPVPLELRKGFAVLDRTWKSGDEVELVLPMPVRRAVSHEKVAANAGRVALERGPLVYCFEAVDCGGSVEDLYLPGDAAFSAMHRPGFLGGATVLRGKAERVVLLESGARTQSAVEVQAVPYALWAHRDLGEMAVWLPEAAAGARPRPLPTFASKSRASASHVWSGDTVTALNDQVEPESSGDHGIPRFTWWDHREGTEWVQYEFPQPATVSESEVYWFDDTGRGACRLPQSARLLYRAGEEWLPVRSTSAGELEADCFQCVAFEAVSTTAVRLEVTLRAGFSAGILEWRVR